MPHHDGMSRRVVVVVYPGIQSLDVTGPVEVFSTANRQTGTSHYRFEIVASTAGAVDTSSGLGLRVDQPVRSVRGPIDTLLVAGGDGVTGAIADAPLVAAVRRLARHSRRVTSVCSGAFVLAEAGLLDGRRATTHWSVCDLMARRYPNVTVDADPIFVRDGNVMTSAGVTAGMDLALALVEDDLGRDVALTVARQLVLFLRRPGSQSQFSAQLAGQIAERDPLRDAQRFIAEQPDADLSVAALARRAGMSERNFARCFRDEVGVTPARYVEQARVETARRLLEETDGGVEEIARRSGFGTAETMRRTFVRIVRTSPNDYRRRFTSVA
jgi:transcriptional regulator GlxA family with amidase domain